MMGRRMGIAVGCLAALLSMILEADAAGVRVRCEQRPDRSKVSVNGFDLDPADGTFAARVTSGLNSATSESQAAIAGEAQFDFDSDAGDIAAGATEIAADFIQDGQVTGEILDDAGNTVAVAMATCRVR